MAATTPILILFFSLTLFCLLSSPTSAISPCTDYHFANNNVFASCNDLPGFNSSIHWSYYPNSHKVDLAYRLSGIGGNSKRWIAWAINPNDKGMIGAQALVAFQRSDGTIVAYPSSINSYRTRLEDSRNLSFPVRDLYATYTNDDDMIIFASIELPVNGSTIVHHLWQEGPVLDDIPRAHAMSTPNLRSYGDIDFLSGKIRATSIIAAGGDARTRLKNIHGVLNAISWGTLMPLGVIIARYAKLFNSADPAWFYLHVTCQCSAYAIGVAGWGTGLKLGSMPGVKYGAHGCIGILLFCLATLQVVSLKLRPNKDHRYRVYWDAYHRLIGYSTIALGVYNVFKGIHILDPEKKWKDAYLAVILVLGSVAVILEAFAPVFKKLSKQDGTIEAMRCDNGSAEKEVV